jgi:uncharacterized membrane protein SpoIIM required for sporulation
MVLEDIIRAKSAERQPLYILPLAFLYASIALFVALWIFPSSAAIVAVFLIAIATMPLFLDVVVFEKTKEEGSRNYLRELLTFGRGVDKEKLFPFFIYLFLGLALAVAFWFSVLPSSMLNDLFHIQLNTIKEINLSLASGGAAFTSFFSAILANNVKVLAFSVLFSFIYGAGAMFILAWNASVIGVAMGDTIRSSLAAASKAIGGATGIVTYSSAVSTGLFRYLLHGIPEILAYFIGALAGGMLSIAVAHQEFNTDKFRKTAVDVTCLVGLAILLLIVAAVVEVTISPLVH